MSIITAGIDEVGLGALAGPVISVVATFRPPDLTLLPPGVTDSKKLTEEKREQLYLPICKAALDIGVGWAWPWEIDEMGVTDALQLSYKRALGELTKGSPDLLYVDGIHPVREWFGKQHIEPKADFKYREVSAASIVAKFIRDQMMIVYAREFTKYGWKKNKGYGTNDHESAIRQHGVLIDGTDKRRNLHRVRYCKKFLFEGGPGS
jgi:ribonuclease HII